MLAFNVGIEIGQVLVLAIMIPALAVIRRYVLQGRVGMIIVSALVAHTGWHWMLDRAEVLWTTTWTSLAVLPFWIGGMLLAAGGIASVAKRLKLTAQAALASPKEGSAD